MKKEVIVWITEVFKLATAVISLIGTIRKIKRNDRPELRKAVIIH